MRVIIPSDNPILARRCLGSLASSDPSFLARSVIVTGDASEFAPLVMEYPEVEFIEHPGPFNFAGRVNVALGDEGDVFLLNDDTELLTEGGLTVIAALISSGQWGILSAAIRGTGGVIEQRQKTPRSVRLMPGDISFTAVAISRQCIDKLGLLDERFDGYGFEDNDYCQRAREQNIRIGTFDGCVVAHMTPHSTFSRRDDFGAAWLRNETLFREKWSTAQPTALIISPSRGGGATLAGVVDAMGFTMPDPPASFEKKVSEYYRDDQLAREVKRGEWGIRDYIAGRDLGDKPWGTRLWPQPDAAAAFLDKLCVGRDLRIIFAERTREARINSYVMSTASSHRDALTRVESEDEGMRRIVAYADDAGLPYIWVSYDHLVEDTPATVAAIAEFLGYDKSTAIAEARVRGEYRLFLPSGDIIERAAPDDFGRVAIGVRLSHPEAAFTGCLMRLLSDGLREGDEVLDPVIRTPSHWAASTLMRRLLSSGCDTLLMIDDDMTFPPDLLSTLRDNDENWRYDIVSALATQRIPPPRALVLRRGQQPELPDALNGLYYDLIADGVVKGETLPVDATGFAFTLIRREVIERMTDPTWGAPFSYYVRWGEGGEGEDVNFCRRAGSLGFRVAVDAGAHVGHIGSVVYGYDEFDQWRARSVGMGVRAEKLVGLLEAALPLLDQERRADALAILDNARER